MALPDTLRAIAVTSKSGSSCTADIGGVQTVIEVARDLSVTAGDALLVIRAGNTWFAIARVGLAAPTDSDTDAGVPTTPVTDRGRLVISPVQTASYRSLGWRSDTDNVYQGQYAGNGNHTGCAFYGSKARTLAGATVLGATVKIRRVAAGGQASAQRITLNQVVQSTKPAGAPTLASSTTGPKMAWGATQTGFVLPTSWGQALVDGTIGGLACYVSSGDPYMITAGRGAWSPAWTIVLDWQR